MSLVKTVGAMLTVGLMVWLLGAAATEVDAHQVGREVERRQRIEIFGRDSQIGVTIRDVDEADVEREDLTRPSGAVVESIRDTSPADEAGVRAGDIVVEFDGERIRSARQLTRVVRETPTGRTVGMMVLRDRQRQELRITPETGPSVGIVPLEGIRRFGENFGRHFEDLGRRFEEFDWSGLDRRRERFGVSVQGLNPQLAEYFGVEEGVLVTRVTENSPAAEAGLRAGDVILSIDGRTVTDIGDVRRRIERVETGEEFPVSVMRDRQPLTVQATVESRSERPRRRRSVRRPI